MSNMISIKENKDICVEDKVFDFLNPDYLYIPIEDGLELNVKTDSIISKEQVLLKGNDKFIYSPISGRVVGASTSLKYNNKSIKTIVIENDFKEKVTKKKGTKRYINNYSREELISLIKKYNAYSGHLDEFAKTMVINGIDREPYERTVSYIINNHSSQILETIDALSEILEIDSTILAINNNDSNNVINLTNNIGTYPNITLKLVPDTYPIGFKDILIKNIVSKKQESTGVIYFTAQDIYAIYNVLKKNKPITETLITLSGDAISEQKVINVKIGTTISDIIANCCTIDNDKYFVVVNGLLSGTTLETLNNIVTLDVKSIFVTTCKSDKEKKCINCGLCNSKCPVGLNPKYLKDHPNADRSKCINCGLCTFICPSKINFKPYLGGSDEQ